MLKQYLETGKIVGTHGVKGMLRVQPWCDSGEFLCKFKKLYTDENGLNSLDITKSSVHGNIVLLSVKGIETIEQAEKLRNKIIYLNRKDAKLPEGRYFIEDLIGCTVYNTDNEILGELSDVSVTGANDVWHITKDDKEYLVPAIPQVIISVKPEIKNIIINPMKGIFDDEN